MLFHSLALPETPNPYTCQRFESKSWMNFSHYLSIHAQHFDLWNEVKSCCTRVFQYHPLLGQEEELSPGQVTPGAGGGMDEKDAVLIYSTPYKPIL